MAYEIIGTVLKTSTTETIQTKSGQPFQRRSLTLIQRRFDPNTGQEFEPNYPTIDFTQRGCQDLDRFQQGDRVRVRFEVQGVKYTDKVTGEERYMNRLRGFRIEPYVVQQPQQPQSYAPASQWQQPAPHQPQQAYCPPQQQPVGQLFPPQNVNPNDPPF